MTMGATEDNDNMSIDETALRAALNVLPDRQHEIWPYAFGPRHGACRPRHAPAGHRLETLLQKMRAGKKLMTRRPKS